MGDLIAIALASKYGWLFYAWFYGCAALGEIAIIVIANLLIAEARQRKIQRRETCAHHGHQWTFSDAGWHCQRCAHWFDMKIRHYRSL